MKFQDQKRESKELTAEIEEAKRAFASRALETLFEKPAPLEPEERKSPSASA